MKINLFLFLIICILLVNCAKKENWETYSVNKTDNGNGAFAKNLPADFQMPTDETGKKVLKEYGAVFIAKGDVSVPKTVILKDEAAVAEFAELPNCGNRVSVEAIQSFHDLDLVIEPKALIFD